jgi:drug/metabolite transporter (DMT)-like permease
MRRLQSDLILLFSAAIWGLTFLFQKSALHHVEPLTFVAARCALAALALAPLAARERNSAGAPAETGFLTTAVGGGIAFFLAAWLQQAGLETATVTNTAFLTALYVVLTPFLSWALTGKTPARVVWAAAGLSAVGTWLLGGAGIGAFERGDLLVAASAVFWAAHVVITGQAAWLSRPIGFTCLQFAVVSALAGSSAALFEDISLTGLVAAARDIIFVGLLSTALTFTLLTVALKHTPAAEAAVIVSLETVFAATAGYLALGERLTGAGWVGAGLILLAVLTIQLAPVLALGWHFTTPWRRA